MTRRASPYPPRGFGVQVPAGVWSAALDQLRLYGSRGDTKLGSGSEGLVFLGGVVLPDQVIVTTLYCIDHAAQGDQVHVTPEEATWLIRSLRQRDEKLLVQIHSHRGAAGHSHGDELSAASFHAGFLSIVAPAFARVAVTIEQCAVFEHRNSRFHQLGAPEIHDRFRIEPEVVHIRPNAQPPTGEGLAHRPWSRFVQKLRLIARRPR